MQPEARRVNQIYCFIVTSFLDDDLLFSAIRDRKIDYTSSIYRFQ